MHAIAITTCDAQPLPPPAGQRWQSLSGDVLWQGLSSGAWSLTRSFEREGCVQLELRGNAAQTRATRALDEHELRVLSLVGRGHSSKHAAYELEVSQTQISTCIKSACRKLGVHTRIELIQLLHLAQTRSPGTETATLNIAAGEPRTLRVSCLAPPQLTPAEGEIFQAILRGLTNAQISQRRARSLRTVANQVASMFQKLGVNSRAELVAQRTSSLEVLQQEPEPSSAAPSSPSVTKRLPLSPIRLVV